MNTLEMVKKALEIEAEAVRQLSQQVDESYVMAIDVLRECKGKVIVTAVGKSGIVGKKIAASLSSTGTPACFVHSTEGVHGDSGLIEETDVVILISNSGETEEVLNILSIVDQIGSKKIAITSNGHSTLAKACDVALVYAYKTEADHLDLAPTTSSTLTLVLGDALAVTLSALKGFEEEDFHLYHPGGSLGQRLSS